MKKVLFLTLFIAFAGMQSGRAQMTAESAMKTYTKVKGQFDNLMAKYKPYKDMAIQNADKLSPELQTSIKNLDGQIAALSKKLTTFPNSTASEQISMASSLKSDYSSVKTATGDVIKSIKGMKLPEMPKM